MENQTLINSGHLSEYNSAISDLPTTQIIPGNFNQETNLEATTLLEIFPNEIWLHILCIIGKPVDLSSLGNSSGFFRELFQLLKTKILFPEVIKVIVANLPATAKEVRQILLNCRLVCQYWEFGVGSVLNSLATNCKLVEVYQVYNSDCRPFPGITTKFRKAEDILAFLQHFDESYASKNRTPFLDGIVCSNFYNRTNRNCFAQLLLQVLRLYGHHVVNFRALRIAPRSNQPEDVILCYKQLREMLQLMPNLRELTISKGISLNTSKEALEALQLHMQSCVFPELASLQRLELWETPLSPVCEALLGSYSHVTILATDYSFTKIKGWLNSTQMPKLTQLAIVLPDNESLIQFETASVTWSLTGVQIRVGSINCDWDKLFQILKNRWAATLTELEIQIISGHNDTTMKFLPCLELPNLKLFHVFSTYFISLDFILLMSNTLEHLQVWYSAAAADDHNFIENEKVVKLYSFRRNLTQSNIWTLFPKMKSCYYYDWHVGYYQVSNQRLYGYKSSVVNGFTVQHDRFG